MILVFVPKAPGQRSFVPVKMDLSQDITKSYFEHVTQRFLLGEYVGSKDAA